jgi:ABC-type Fe3+ transport system substrate-binding protein
VKRIGIILALLVLIVAAPILLRRETATASAGSADDRLTIITPHHETIRKEFGNAFAEWWKKRTGRSIYVDWRTPGGTSEIRMVLDAGYKAAKETGREGIGIDVFFGGGEPDFSGQSKQGRLARLEVFAKHPEWFGEHGAVPRSFTGETYYTASEDWVGCCLSRFGICYNPEELARLGVPAPQSWEDLGNPRLAGAVALADPTKSGSVARAFELLIQSQIMKCLAEGKDPRQAVADGWQQGLQLIQRMSANARYFTDSASKIPWDVGQGDAAAGMCIDFYGWSYHEDMMGKDGKSRVEWVAPSGGASLSADPVAVLRGAPRGDIAQAFVEFCMSPEGQRLWSGKPGSPGGPREHALLRTPIRRDLYQADDLKNSAMPGERPYENIGGFSYHKEWTGAAFNTIRNLVRVMCLDSHEEMKSAWLAMRDAGFPPDAMAVFQDVSAVTYLSSGKHGDAALDSPDALVAAARGAELGKWFRQNYRKAEAIAKSQHH